MRWRVLHGTHGELRKDGTRNGGSRRAALRRPSGTAHLRQRLQAGVGAVAGAHEDAAQRVPSATLEERPPGVHRPADGSVLLRRRRRKAQGLRSANSLERGHFTAGRLRYFLPSSSLPNGRKYCVPRIGSLTRRNRACKSSLRSTKSISEVLTISKSDEV